MRGWARIGVLIARLRRLLDGELRGAVDGGKTGLCVDGLADSEVVKVVRWLVELNGQDR